MEFARGAGRDVIGTAAGGVAAQPVRARRIIGRHVRLDELLVHDAGEVLAEHGL